MTVLSAYMQETSKPTSLLPHSLLIMVFPLPLTL